MNVSDKLPDMNLTKMRKKKLQHSVATSSYKPRRFAKDSFSFD